MAIKKFRQQLALGLAVMMAAGSVPVVTHAEELTKADTPQAIGTTPSTANDNDAAVWSDAAIQDFLNKIGDGKIKPESDTTPVGELFVGKSDKTDDPTRDYANSVISYDGYEINSDVNWVTPEQRAELIKLIEDILEETNDELQEAMDEFDDVVEKGKGAEASGTAVTNAASTTVKAKLVTEINDVITKIGGYTNTLNTTGTTGNYTFNGTAVPTSAATIVVSENGNDTTKKWVPERVMRECKDALEEALELFDVTEQSDGSFVQGSRSISFDDVAAEEALQKLKEQKNNLIENQRNGEQANYLKALGLKLNSAGTLVEDDTDDTVLGLYDYLEIANGLMALNGDTDGFAGNYTGDYSTEVTATGAAINSVTFAAANRIKESEKGNGTDVDAGMYWLNTEDFENYKNVIKEAYRTLGDAVVMDNAIIDATPGDVDGNGTDNEITDQIKGDVTENVILEQARVLDKWNSKVLVQILGNGKSDDAVDTGFAQTYAALETSVNNVEKAFDSNRIKSSTLEGVDISKSNLWAKENDYNSMQEAYNYAKTFLNNVTPDDIEELKEIKIEFDAEIAAFFGNSTANIPNTLVEQGELKLGTKEDVETQRLYIKIAEDATEKHRLNTAVSLYDGVDVSEDNFWVPEKVGDNELDKLINKYDDMMEVFEDETADEGDLRTAVNLYSNVYNTGVTVDGQVQKFERARKKGTQEETVEAKKDLNDLIAKINGGIEKIEVSPNANYFSTATYWVTKGQYESFEKLLEEANELIEDPSTNKDDFDDMTEDLEAAWDRLDTAAWDNYRDFQNSIHYKN